MRTGTVALALVQPAGPPAVWSGATFVDRVVWWMVRHHEDVYFRPLVQATSVAHLRWRVMKLRWAFAGENRVFTLGALALLRKRPRVLPSSEELTEFYEHIQRLLSETWFSEETRSRIDYAIYTGMRSLGAMQQTSVRPPTSPRWRQVLQAGGVATSFDLYVGAVCLATLQPQLVRNPLVLDDLARLAAKASDDYVAIAGGFGIVIS